MPTGDTLFYLAQNMLQVQRNHLIGTKQADL